MNFRLLIVFLSLLLSACDIPGLGPDPRIAIREAEARAVGGACRQALRGIEDCYALNEKSPKTAVYEGWKEMDAYMRENKLEGQKPLYGKDARLQAKNQAESDSPAAPREEIIADKKSSSGEKSTGKH